MVKKNVKRRLYCFNLFFLLIIALLSARLAYIQIKGHEELSATALKQQRIRIEGADARGVIYDRNRIPLTGTNKDYVYIIDRKVIQQNGTKTLEDYGARKISNYSQDYVVYTFSEFNSKADEVLRKEYKAYVMEAERRYNNDQVAAHLLGYVKELDGSGASGVELAFNDVLSERKRYLYASADAKGKIIPGIGLSSNIENGATGVVTTLDIKLQEEIERILNENELNGAIVVLESKTGQILAASSTPAFNPNRVKDYIGSSNGELVNKVIQGEYPPGSIFKIIVAVAALENGTLDANGKAITLDSKFLCKGSQELYGINIKCSTGGANGHGEITLKDAFAKSCNSAFIQLGQLTGGKNILKTAEDFGLGEPTLSDIVNEKKGHLTEEADTAFAGIGNLSIGQGSLLVTPIQIARMTNIIANMGVNKGVCLLKDTEKMEEYIISAHTARKLNEMMIATMEYGTGDNITTSAIVAGKTGSAEAYSRGEKVVHGWFTGFFPAEDPKYTITVFVENGRSGRLSAVPIFEKIEKYLTKE